MDEYSIIDVTEMNQIALKNMIEIKNWNDTEVQYVFINYVQKVCLQIKESREWDGEDAIVVIHMNYSKYPYILNECIFYKFVRRFEQIFNHTINMISYTSETRLVYKKKYTQCAGAFGFRLTSKMKKKIESVLQIQF